MYENVCRLCGSQKRYLKPIFSVSRATGVKNRNDSFNIADVIYKCVGLRIKENEDGPKSICRGCFKQLDNWQTFYKSSRVMQESFTSTNKRETSLTPKVVHFQITKVVDKEQNVTKYNASRNVKSFNLTDVLDRDWIVTDHVQEAPGDLDKRWFSTPNIQNVLENDLASTEENKAVATCKKNTNTKLSAISKKRQDFLSELALAPIETLDLYEPKRKKGHNEKKSPYISSTKKTMLVTKKSKVKRNTLNRGSQMTHKHTNSANRKQTVNIEIIRDPSYDKKNISCSNGQQVQALLLANLKMIQTSLGKMINVESNDSNAFNEPTPIIADIDLCPGFIKNVIETDIYNVFLVQTSVDKTKFITTFQDKICDIIDAGPDNFFFIITSQSNIMRKMFASKITKRIQIADLIKESNPPCFQCRFCEKVYPNKRMYNRHISTHINPKEFQCATCSKVYRSKQSLRTHLETHSERRNYMCHICGQFYLTASTLCNHIHGQHGGDSGSTKRYSCSTCGKQFRLGHHLEQHMRIHTGSKPFSCPTCQRQFRSATHLRRHVEAVHQNIKRHVCNICGKQYIHTPHFKAHLIRHSGVRAFQCPTCDKKFVTKHELVKHDRTHTLYKPFKCTMCEKAFSDWSNRKRHIATHDKTTLNQQKGNSKQSSTNCKTYTSLQTFYQSTDVVDSLTETMDVGFGNIEYVNLTVMSTESNVCSTSTDNGVGKSNTDNPHTDGDMLHVKCLENFVDSQADGENILFLPIERLNSQMNLEITCSSQEKISQGLPKLATENTMQVLNVVDAIEADRKHFKPCLTSANGLEVFLENGNVRIDGINDAFFVNLEGSINSAEKSKVSSSKESIVEMLKSQGTIVLETNG